MEREIREGMTVRSNDGKKLGKVIRCAEDVFVVEKGFFFPTDRVVRYDQAKVSGGEVLLSVPAARLREAADEGDIRSRERSASGLGTQLGTYAVDASGRPVEGGDAQRASGEGQGQGGGAPVGGAEGAGEGHARDAGAERGGPSIGEPRE